MTWPLLPEDGSEPRAFDEALRRSGGFFVRPAGDARAIAHAMEGALAAARAFFVLARERKTAIAIERSPHFRGWSEMHNQRDWREQLHLGRDRPSGAGGPPYRRLEGPNLWPGAAAWQGTIGAYLDLVGRLGDALLRLIARGLGRDPSEIVAGDDGYRLLKLIGYHPQRSARVRRPGVAAHVDFSWITINLQDSAGLEVRRPDGTWDEVEVRPGALWVHAGELLEHATNGRYRATPHRVINPSSDRLRVSIPFFVNPPLDAWIPVFPGPRATGPRAKEEPREEREHIHRVLDATSRDHPLHFGEAEWRRKGLDVWCSACCMPGAPSSRKAELTSGGSLLGDR